MSADEITRQRAEMREKALKNVIGMLEDARAEGRAEGVNLGELIGEIRALQRVLHHPVQSKETLMAVSLDELHAILHELEANLQTESSMKSL